MCRQLVLFQLLKRRAEASFSSLRQPNPSSVALSPSEPFAFTIASNDLQLLALAPAESTRHSRSPPLVRMGRTRQKRGHSLVLWENGRAASRSCLGSHKKVFAPQVRFEINSLPVRSSTEIAQDRVVMTDCYRTEF